MKIISSKALLYKVNVRNFQGIWHLYSSIKRDMPIPGQVETWINHQKVHIASYPNPKYFKNMKVYASNRFNRAFGFEYTQLNISTFHENSGICKTTNSPAVCYCNDGYYPVTTKFLTICMEKVSSKFPSFVGCYS